MTTEPWLKVTPKMFKEGWYEIRGVQTIHRTFEVIAVLDDGNYVVKNPKLVVEEEALRHGSS